MTEGAPQRDFPLREVFNGLRYIVKTGAPWRWMPHNLPPWQVVYKQAQRWIEAGVFESLPYDLCAVLRIAEGRKESPIAAIIDSRTLQSTPESGGRAGYDGAKRRKGSKVHLAVETLGHLLALYVTAADEQTALKSQNSPKVCKRRPAKQSRSPTLIKTTRAKTRPMRLGSMASCSKRSNFQRRREDMSSYLDYVW
jgi:transposase